MAIKLKLALLWPLEPEGPSLRSEDAALAFGVAWEPVPNSYRKRSCAIEAALVAQILVFSDLLPHEVVIAAATVVWREPFQFSWWQKSIENPFSNDQKRLVLMPFLL